MSITKKVLIFGSNGLFGSSLTLFLKNSDYQVYQANRSGFSDYKIDFTDVNTIISVLESVKPDYVVNLIAATNVDICEKNIPLAVEANTIIPDLISKIINKYFDKDIHLIYISSDQVYDGTGNHKEEIVGPVNVYGLTKLAGELMMKNSFVTTLRTNFFGKSKCRQRYSFSDWVIGSLQKKDKITLFEDVIFSALNIETLCEIVELVMRNSIFGTYNLGTKDSISKAGFAIEFARLLGLPMTNYNVGRITSQSFFARRPLDMSLDVTKFESAAGIKCPSMIDEIQKTIQEYRYV